MLEFSTAFVAIAVHQWDAMVKFYSSLTKQQPEPHLSGRYAEFNLGGLRIGLFSPKVSHQPEFVHGHTAKMSLCLEVKKLEQGRLAIDTAYEEALPFSMHREHSRYGDIAIASHGRECYAYDPDGNRLILHEAVSLKNET